jgi:hypothetical protein
MGQATLTPQSSLEEDIIAPKQAWALSPGALREVEILTMGKSEATGSQGSIQDRHLEASTSRTHYPQTINFS